MTTPPCSDSESLHVLVGRIDGKMDLMLTQSVSHEARIASLEAWRNRLVGAVAIVGAIQFRVPFATVVHILGF